MSSSFEEEGIDDDAYYNPNDTMLLEAEAAAAAAAPAELESISKLWGCAMVEKGNHPDDGRLAWKCLWCERWFPGGWNVTKALVHVSRMPRLGGAGRQICLCPGDIPERRDVSSVLGAKIGRRISWKTETTWPLCTVWLRSMWVCLGMLLTERSSPLGRI